MKTEAKNHSRDRKTFLTSLHADGSTFQLAAIGVRRPTSKRWDGYATGPKPIVLGWFQDYQCAAEVIKNLDSDSEIAPKGTYISVNPIKPALLSRSNHRLRAGISATRNEDVECLRHLLIDIDPIRPPDTNSSNEEHQLALDKAEEILRSLKRKKWPAPLIIDTGNGACLIYCLPDLPNDQIHQEILRKCLVALALRFDDQKVEIDQAVYNPSRLTRVPGTLNRKGDSTADRPQRWATIVSKPRALRQVSLEKLSKLASECPEEKADLTPIDTDSGNTPPGHLDVSAYLKKYGRKMVGTKPNGSSTLFILEECVFDPSHKGKEAAIVLTSSGKLLYQCFHASCKGRKWGDARKIISGDDKLTPFIVKPQPMRDQAHDGVPPHNHYEPIDLRAVSFNGVVQLPREDNSCLIERVSYTKTPILITGQTGIGKSELGINLAFAFASGGSFLGEWQVLGNHRVLILQSENTSRNLQDRIQRLPYDWSGKRREMQDRLFFLENNGTLQVSGPLVDKNGEPTRLATAIREMISELGVDIVIFDPLSSYHVADENDNTRMRRVLDVISTYVCAGSDVTAVVLHHQGKMNKERSGSYLSRGASAVSDWAGVHLSLTWAKGNGRGVIKAEWVKSRDFPSPGSIMVRRSPDGRLEKIQDEVSQVVSHQEVIRILREMGDRSESKEALSRRIVEELNVSRGTALKAINDACERGRIRMEGSRRGRPSPISVPHGCPDD